MRITIKHLPAPDPVWWILDDTPMVLGHVYQEGDRFRAVIGYREGYGTTKAEAVCHLLPTAIVSEE